jgi:hypothetical protein
MSQLVQYVDPRTQGLRHGQLIKKGRKWATVREMVPRVHKAGEHRGDLYFRDLRLPVADVVEL